MRTRYGLFSWTTFIILVPGYFSFLPTSHTSRRTSFLLVSKESPVKLNPVSPVLVQVYPAILEHVEKYGNPNIPLGTSDGRMCQTLRRLHTQQRLPESDVALLEDLKFTWHSLEDVYHTADFEELFRRLVAYGQDYSPPKKYPSDPELGAWVTGLRRVGRDEVPASHRKRLDDLGFLWTSPRKCGSAFMKQYRELMEKLESADDENGRAAIIQQDEIQEWVKAQRQAVKRGALSETRRHYLAEIFGEAWEN